MRHPSEATLALFAGGELGFWSRWRAGRHVSACERCRGEVDDFSDLREDVQDLNALPGVSWNRLAAEMKANIRLGLAAGECVRPDAAYERPKGRRFLGPKALVAYASVVALVAAGALIERPAPRVVHETAAVQGSVLEATGNGIELKEGSQSLSLLHGNATEVTYTAGAQGSMRARYVDADTGYITINNVYAQ